MIEVNQTFLGEHLDAVAAAVQRLLALTDTETERLEEAFRHDYPERTSAIRPAAADLRSMGWTDGEMRIFDTLCAETMAAFGYSTDVGYYRPGCAGDGLVWI